MVSGISTGGHQSSYNNLEGYVKGGGKIALLVSRDLTRVTGSCVSLANKSKRKLYRWDGENVEEYSRSRLNTAFSTNWVHLGVELDFDKLFSNFSSTPNRETQPQSTGISVPSDDTPASEDIQFDENAILWMPLRQPMLMQDGGGTGNRSSELLKQNLLISKWALADTESSSSRDDTWGGKTIIIGGFNGDLPPELKSVTHIIRWEYPSRNELRDLIFGQTGEYVEGVFQSKTFRGNNCGSIMDKLGKQQMFSSGALAQLASDEYHNDNENFIQKMVVAAQGLDIEDCKVAVLSSFRDALEENKPLLNGTVIKRVMNRKIELLSSDGLLTIENTGTHETIGGYTRIVGEIENLKVRFNSSQGEKYGIKPPKGVILTGVPGCGKSLTAKTIADVLDCPLIGFDLGKITTSMYGESEERMHKALNTVTGMAPCVLWIDEFEKMFSSASSEGGSHEVSQRMNAIFLKWMEERTNNVFVVATSNDLSGIKAEYQRTGRWDGTYFFDLPSRFERKSIIEAILGGYKKSNFQNSISDEEIDVIVNQTEGWAGSDINGLLKESKNATYDRWLTAGGDDSNPPVLLFSAILEIYNSEKIKPLFIKDIERLNKIRREGEGSYTPASDYPEGDEKVELPEQNQENHHELTAALLQMFGAQRRL